MSTTKAYAAPAASVPLEPFTLERRTPGAHDVQIDILFCGVCHSDLHQIRDEWGGSIFPMVPGHEIVGRVSAVGDHVQNFKVGDIAGVGCMVDSCRTCPSCQDGLEQYCETTGMVGTYNGPRNRQRPAHLRRLLAANCGGRKVHPQGQREARPSPRGPAAVRRHHHLFAPAPMESGPRPTKWA